MDTVFCSLKKIDNLSRRCVIVRKISPYFILYAFVSLLLVSEVLAISRRHDVSDHQYIQLASSYLSVGRFINGFSNGSGVLIAPQWVLMASHNLMFQTAPFAFEIGGETYRIDWSKRHFAALPRPYGADLTHDIALVHLDRPVNNVSPAQLYVGNDELDMVVTIVGYGIPGDGLHGVPIGGSQEHKRAGQNIIDAIGHYDGRQVTVDASGTLIFYDFDNPANVPEAQNWFGGPNTPLALEGMATSGDSGGGVFVETPTGRKLIGINSGVFPGVSAGSSHKYGIISRNVRVSSFISWINKTMTRFESGNEPLKGIVAHWDFDDLSEGFAQDVSGVGHRGNIVRARPTAGIIGGAIEFRTLPEKFRLIMTQQDYIEVPNTTRAWKGVVANDLKIEKDITIAVWVYRVMSGGVDGKAASDIDTIVAKVPVSEKRSDFSFIIWENHLRFYGSSDNYARSPTHHVPYRMWQHVAATRAGDTVKFYINGQLIGEDQLPESFTISDNPLIIGNFPDTGFNFNGKMDDLRIYNRSLNQGEVMLLADADTLNAHVSYCDDCPRDAAMHR
jgi:Concanavalin A-like lectin/glucanases superfamily